MTDITLPDTTGSRIRRPGASTDAPAPVDDVAQTLAEYERLAISTGASVQIDAAEYTGDGETWSQLWFDETTPPLAARVTVWRDGVPTTILRTWREAVPAAGVLADDGRQWCDIWSAQPMRRFESYVIRAALARAFRDVIGHTYEPGDPRVRSNGAAAPELAAAVAGPLSPEQRAEHERLAEKLLASFGVVDAVLRPTAPAVGDKIDRDVAEVESRPMPSPAPRRPAPETRPAPKPETRPMPKPTVPGKDRPRREYRPPRETAISQAIREAEQESGKSVSRKSSSRAQRDSGRRGGGRR